MGNITQVAYKAANTVLHHTLNSGRDSGGHDIQRHIDKIYGVIQVNIKYIRIICVHLQVKAKIYDIIDACVEPCGVSVLYMYIMNAVQIMIW